jgi:hypothetical protein
MNTAVEVMTALASHDAQVVVEGDRVRLLFSASHRSPEALVEAARFHKQALRAILENRQKTSPSGLYDHLLAALRSKRPHLVEPDRWQQAIRDADSFLTTWGQQAEALGWTTRELFGLHPPPERLTPSYSRLSRYDETGLIWLLRGRPVIALTETTAAIQGATGVIVYRKHAKPVLGPLGDSLDDFGAVT